MSGRAQGPGRTVTRVRLGREGRHPRVALGAAAPRLPPWHPEWPRGTAHFPEWSPLGREAGGECARPSFLLCQQKTAERGKGKLCFRLGQQGASGRLMCAETRQRRPGGVGGAGWDERRVGAGSAVHTRELGAWGRRRVGVPGLRSLVPSPLTPPQVPAHPTPTGSAWAPPRQPSSAPPSPKGQSQSRSLQSWAVLQPGGAPTGGRPSHSRPFRP